MLVTGIIAFVFFGFVCCQRIFKRRQLFYRDSGFLMGVSMLLYSFHFLLGGLQFVIGSWCTSPWQIAAYRAARYLGFAFFFFAIFFQGTWFLSMTSGSLTSVGNAFAGKLGIMLVVIGVAMLFIYGAVLPWPMFLFGLSSSRSIRGGGELTVDAISCIVLCCTLEMVLMFLAFTVGDVLKELGGSQGGDWRKDVIQRITVNQTLFIVTGLIYAVAYLLFFTLVMIDARIVRGSSTFAIARYIVINWMPLFLGLIMVLPFLKVAGSEGKAGATSSTDSSSSLADSLLQTSDSSSSSSSSSSSTSSSSSVELSEI
jgi:hypothetical protein